MKFVSDGSVNKAGFAANFFKGVAFKQKQKKRVASVMTVVCLFVFHFCLLPYS